MTNLTILWTIGSLSSRLTLQHHLQRCVLLRPCSQSLPAAVSGAGKRGLPFGALQEPTHLWRRGRVGHDRVGNTVSSGGLPHSLQDHSLCATLVHRQATSQVRSLHGTSASFTNPDHHYVYHILYILYIILGMFPVPAHTVGEPLGSGKTTIYRDSTRPSLNLLNDLGRERVAFDELSPHAKGSDIVS